MGQPSKEAIEAIDKWVTAESEEFAKRFVAKGKELGLEDGVIAVNAVWALISTAVKMAVVGRYPEEKMVSWMKDMYTLYTAQAMKR